MYIYICHLCIIVIYVYISLCLSVLYSGGDKKVMVLNLICYLSRTKKKPIGYDYEKVIS